MAKQKSAYLVWKPKAGPRKRLYFDVVTTEQQENILAVTEHAVEKGGNIADHVRKQLDRLSLDVFVSNTPIDDVNGFGGAVSSVPLKVEKYTPPLEPTPGSLNAAVGGAISGLASALMGKNEQIKATVLQFSKPFDAVAFTNETLRRLQDTSQLVEVWTTSHDFDNLIVESFTQKKDAGTGTGATFAIQFRRLNIVHSKLVTAPAPTEARGMPIKKKGEQPASSVSASQEKILKSHLAKITERVDAKLAGLPGLP